MRSGKALPLQRGLACVLLLAAVAIIGIVSANAIETGAMLGRRDQERQLLAIGAEFRRALASYNAALAGQAPGTPLAGPKSLEELLADPRVPGVRRHLRQIHADPLTGQAVWGLQRDAQGSIVGIYSLAGGTPIRQTGFEPGLESFEAATSYAGWVFTAQPPLERRPQ